MTRDAIGLVASLWRYPVKSMMGEELNAADVTERGLVGDRAYGLIDRATGKLASAKHPRKWARLFDFHAVFVEPPRAGSPVPAVRITFPDGVSVTSEESDLNRRLSQTLGREVTFAASAPEAAIFEEVWPEVKGSQLYGRVLPRQGEELIPTCRRLSARRQGRSSTSRQSTS
jgi:uncharacterized protein